MKFESFRNARIVRSGWLEDGGRRLDCNPYMSGALEAREALINLKVPKEPLASLTAGFAGGIYNGPMFARRWVTTPEYGVPFLGSSDMLKADLRGLPMLNRRYAESPRLRHLEVRSGTTMITCSGTIGRMTFAREDMDGMWSSQHIMKVVPNESKIPSGYLYAFLASKFGVLLVVAGTYGSIIQSIEAEHLVGLPVPRFGEDFENQVDTLVKNAALARTQAIAHLENAETLLYSSLSMPIPSHPDQAKTPDVTCIPSKLLTDRCDAYYYCTSNTEARSAFDQFPNKRELGSVSEVFIPNIFKRLYASDPSFGNPYITGGDVFELSTTADKFLTKNVANEYRLLLQKGMIVVQEAGQLGGLIGRSVMIGSTLDGYACSNNMIRIVPTNDLDGGYLFALLNSEYGVRLLSREAAGSSIPHTDAGRVQRIEIPWPDQRIRSSISKLAITARDLRDEACRYEASARLLIESRIERGD